jgi:hypothetical protein
MTTSGLSLLLLLFIGATTLSLAGDQECTLQEQTPSDQLGPFYVANSCPEDFLNDPARRLEVSGRVLSSIDCNVGLAGEEYRGQVVTNECGFYQLVQAFPALYPTRPILHDHFRLSRNGQELLVTQMYFIGTDEGFVSSDDTAHEMQAVSIQDANGTHSVEFNMYVNLQEEQVSSSASCQGSSNTTDSPVSIPVLEPVLQQQPQKVEDTTSSSIKTQSSTSPASIITTVTTGQFILSVFFIARTLLL